MSILFQSIFAIILELDEQVLYNSRIGVYLKQILFDLEEKKKLNWKFNRLKHQLKAGINKIRVKLTDNFFTIKKTETIFKKPSRVLIRNHSLNSRQYRLPIVKKKVKKAVKF